MYATVLVWLKGLVPGSILGLSGSYLCTFLRDRLPMVHPDSLRNDSLSYSGLPACVAEVAWLGACLFGGWEGRGTSHVRCSFGLPPCVLRLGVCLVGRLGRTGH